VKVIAIKADSREHGEFVLESLQQAVSRSRVALDDLALVTRDDDGKVQIQQTGGDVTPQKGAKRGALVGALVGLAAPPLLGAAAVGAGVGALYGRLRDKGIDDDLMKQIGGTISSGEAVVFALGSDASVQAIADKVRDLTHGDMETLVIDPDDEGFLRDAAVDIPAPTQTIWKLPS